MMKISLIVALVVLVATSAFCACPDGWDKFHQNCYLFTLGKADWIGAKKMCEWHSSELIEIESAQEQAFFQKIARTFNHTTDDEGFWLGATDFVKEGTWVWESSGQELTYTSWGLDQPNNRNNSENCLCGVHYFDYSWSDDPCDWSTHLQIACEKPENSFPILG